MDGLDNLEGLSSLGDSDPLRTEGLPVSLRGCCSLGMPLLVLCHSTAQGWLIGEERKRTPILQMVALLFWKLRVTGGARKEYTAKRVLLFCWEEVFLQAKMVTVPKSLNLWFSYSSLDFKECLHL